MPGKPWTEDETRTLEALAAAGKTDRQIAAALPHRTRPSVSQKRASMGVAPGAIRETDDIPASPHGLPYVPLNDIEDTTRGDSREIRVLASDTIRSVDALIERAEVDLDIWEPHEPTIKKWDVAMKMDDGPVVVELYYVAVKLRMRAEAAFDLRPINLTVHAPKTPKPGGRGVTTTVHYGDLHMPYHDQRAVSILHQVIERVNPTTVVDHGDTGDCSDISKYEKDPSARIGLDTEVQMMARHHAAIHALTPDADHMWLLGNHEDRLRRLIWDLADNRAAGQILTLPAVTEALRWENLTGVGALGWEVVPYPEHRVLKDKLILIHGNDARKHSGQTAKSEYQRYGKSGMSGHSHRRGIYEHRDWNGWHAWWEIGLLGVIRHDYTAFADWQQGFAVVSWSTDAERFNVEEVRIHDGTAFFRGERLDGDPEAFPAAEAA